jgi:hypothetical protein
MGGQQPHGSVGSSFVRNVTGGILATLFLTLAGWLLNNAFWIMAQALRHGHGAKVEMPEDGEAKPKPTLAEKGKGLLEKVKEKTHDLKEGGGIAKPVVNTVKKAEEKVEKTAKEGVEKVTEAIRGSPGNQSNGGIFGTPEERARVAAEKQKAREAAQRDVLIVQARDLGVTVDPNWSFARLNAEVGSARMKQMQKNAPNARCPRCRYPAHLNPNKKGGEFVCPNPKCGAVSSRKHWLQGGLRR